MKKLQRFQALLASLLLALGPATGAADEGGQYFPRFADGHTVALWLFDDADYVSATLTDAGANEYDLRLLRGGRLVPGKFGRALRVSAGSGPAVAFAGFQGAISLKHMRDRGRGGDGGGTDPVGLYSPTIAPQKLLEALAGKQWTLEFWLLLEKAPAEAVVFDLGQAYDPGFTLALANGRFEIADAYAGWKAVCPTDTASLTDGRWRHLTFTRLGDQVRHYLDGKPQGEAVASAVEKSPVPPSIVPDARGKSNKYFAAFTAATSEDWRRRRRFNAALGTDRRGGRGLEGLIDEVRLSDVVRYTGRFTVPGSFSRNVGLHPPAPATPSGPPLLFAAPGPDAPRPGPVRLGSRKHLFIDDVLLDTRSNLRLTCNPPTGRQDIAVPGGRAPGNSCVLDHDGKVYLYVPEGYSSARGMTQLLTSADGLHFTAPELGVVEEGGSRRNNFVLAGRPSYGTFFKDANPAVGPEERFKYTAWVANRGIYVFVSPDGVHWRRNETVMLPFASGGGVETYWDDQRGLYASGIRRDSSWLTPEHPGTGRRVCVAETKEVLKPWPFKALERPYFEGWPFPSLTGELPVSFGPNRNGEVYRSRVVKYPWAPDVYLAFAWRFQKQNHERRLVDLGVSRDGVHWKFFADQAWYISSDREPEALSVAGLIRRGDEIWQYTDYGGPHGNGPRTFARLRQRLDGLVSLDAAREVGTATTRPLVFAGDRLVLNVDAEGCARVALLDEQGRELPGFAAADCDPIRKDATRATVTWKGRSEVGALAGQVVRVRFELQNARLFSFQFARNSGEER